MSVEDNLKESFAGESQANRKYTAFARKADKENLPGVARLFRAVAAAETVHALAELDTLGGVKSTLENLKAAKSGEEFEFKQMYPAFIENAKAASNAKAQRVMQFAMDVEKVHADLYAKAIAAVEAGKDLEVSKMYVCPICGYTAETKPDKCPVCGATRFDEIV